MRRPSKGTVRFLPVLILVLLAVLPAHVGSLWTGAVKLAMAEDAAKGDRQTGQQAARRVRRLARPDRPTTATARKPSSAQHPWPR